jgi:hypothetical protein
MEDLPEHIGDRARATRSASDRRRDPQDEVRERGQSASGDSDHEDADAARHVKTDAVCSRPGAGFADLACGVAVRGRPPDIDTLDICVGSTCAHSARHWQQHIRSWDGLQVKLADGLERCPVGP